MTVSGVGALNHYESTTFHAIREAHLIAFRGAAQTIFEGSLFMSCSLIVLGGAANYFKNKIKYDVDFPNHTLQRMHYSTFGILSRPTLKPKTPNGKTIYPS